MTAPALPRFWDRPLERISLRPAEGWLTVLMVVVLVEAFAWSLIDAAWVPPNEGSVGHLSFLAGAGILVEFVGAKAGWGRWRTHLIGALLAGLVLPIVAGATILGLQDRPVDLTDLAAIYHAAGGVAFRVWADLARDGRPFTSQFGHYHMVFGALVWAAGMSASSAVFGRHRPFEAVVVPGLLLLANMTISQQGDDQLPYLVVFSIAALVLLVRSHTFEEQVMWVRRRIGDPAAVSALYLQGGAIFIAGAVFAALVLTKTASSAPLQGLWTDLPSRLSGLSDFIKKIAPPGGAPRPFGALLFGSSGVTSGVFEPVSGVAFTVSRASADTTPFKWRAGSYTTYDGVNRWSSDDSTTVDVAPGDDVLAGMLDDPVLLPNRHKVVATVTPDAYSESKILSPQSILSVDRPTSAVLTGDRLTTLQERDLGGPYTITALITVTTGTDALTQNELRAASTIYPDDVKAAYLDVPPGALGPESFKILDDVRSIANQAGTPIGNPYDFAKTLESQLHSSRFIYNTNVRQLAAEHCSTLSTAECFATIKQGYCEYYATFMVLGLRNEKIPARIAYGFLPGHISVGGAETVDASLVHWWVEAYFPGYGWIEFDPTGGSRGQPQALPRGGTETPRPVGSGPFGTRRGERDQPTGRGANGGSGSTGSASSPGAGPFAVVGLLLALSVLVAVLSARRRRLRFPVDPDHAWGGIGQLAARFGLGPRPTQTVYEYAGALADAVPAARAELSTVARAKVEVAYGRHTLEADRLRAVGEAYRRLRFAILRKGLGRWFRRTR